MEEETSTATLSLGEDNNNTKIRSDSCVTEYTYDCLDLDSSDEEFDLIETMEEESVNEFFSATPEAVREQQNSKDIVKTRARKWTVYDLTSAKFIPASS